MSDKGFLRISRCIIDHWIYQDAEYFKVWFEMIHRARYSSEPETKLIEGQLVTLNRGEFVFGRKSWSMRLGISERRLRTLIQKLIQDNMIELVKKYNKFTIYRIVNYEKYNWLNDQQEILENEYFLKNSDQQATVNFGKTNNNLTVTDLKIDQHSDQQIGLKNSEYISFNDQQSDQQMTTKRPTNDQQVTTKKQSSNKVNKVNKDIYISIVEYLNQKANKSFKPTTRKTQSFINARLNEGFTLDDFKKVIDIKCSQWLGTEMEKYLRPETLFGTKFEGYLNEKMKQTRDTKEGNIPNYGW